MSTWAEQDLRRIGDAEELELSSRRAEGTLRSYVTMWVVRVGDDLYVRSAYGPENPWFRYATTSGAGRIRAGNVEADVTFTEADLNLQTEIDAAYHAKYDHYGPKIVTTVVGNQAHAMTIQLVRSDD